MREDFFTNQMTNNLNTQDIQSGAQKAFSSKNRRALRDRKFSCVLEKIDWSVERFLLKLNFGDAFAVAVSGGSDSTTLLLSLAKAAQKNGWKVFVIHVNHNLRSEESSHDALFVEVLCKKLKMAGYNVECAVRTLEKGAVLQLSKKSKMGLEAAARALRYKEFAKFCKEKNCAYLFTAHTKSDNLETLVMRFMEGSFEKGLCGIRACRKMGDFFVARPLLDFFHKDILQYLSEAHQDYCIDSTNCDIRFKRNKIRNLIIPLLDEVAPSWAQSVLNGAKDAQALDDFLDEQSKALTYTLSEGEATFCTKVLKDAPQVVSQRAVFAAISKVAPGKRVPRKVIVELLKLLKRKGRGAVVVMGVELSYNKERFCVKCAEKVPKI